MSSTFQKFVYMIIAIVFAFILSLAYEWSGGLDLREATHEAMFDAGCWSLIIGFITFLTIAS